MGPCVVIVVARWTIKVGVCTYRAKIGFYVVPHEYRIRIQMTLALSAKSLKKQLNREFGACLRVYYKLGISL
jgi:hypothetical protein